MNNLQTPIARQEGLVIQEMVDEVLIYDLNTNKAHCLNQTASLVWKACDGKNSVAEIALDLEKQLNASVPEDLVWLAIDQLSQDNLLEEQIQTKVGGISRREVIKKIGFASMVALPVIGLLSLPQNALAVTCPASICSDTSGSGGCAAGTGCCNGTCVTVGTCAAC